MIATLIFAGLLQTPQNPDLAFEISAMAMADQEVRNRIFNKSKNGQANFSKAEIQELSAMDHANTQRMKSIVRTYGWPTIALVGKEASSDAWLLVQHADQEPKFQAYCLTLLAPLVKSGEIKETNYAYLFDRVALAQGRPQRYGTQAQMSPNGFFISPVENPQTVDKTRKAAGMPSLEEYLKVLVDAYGGKIDPNWRAKLSDRPKKTRKG